MVGNAVHLLVYALIVMKKLVRPTTKLGDMQRPLPVRSTVFGRNNLIYARAHAKCNSVLHSARPHVLHSAGGPYITCIAKQMDKGFAGTQLYKQRVCFFLPLSLLTLDRHNQVNLF